MGWDAEMDRLFDLSQMRRAGYPLAKNDLRMEEWRALAAIEDEYQHAHMKHAVLDALGAAFGGGKRGGE